MRELRGVVLVLLGLLLAANVVSGGPAALVLLIVSTSRNLTLDLQTVMVAVAVPALLLGGLIWLSPWHRELGVRIATGAVVVLMVAVLGPLMLDWLRNILTANGGHLFGGSR